MSEQETRTFMIEVVVNGRPRFVEAEFRLTPDGSWVNVEPIELLP